MPAPNSAATARLIVSATRAVAVRGSSVTSLSAWRAGASLAPGASEGAVAGSAAARVSGGAEPTCSAEVAGAASSPPSDCGSGSLASGAEVTARDRGGAGGSATVRAAGSPPAACSGAASGCWVPTGGEPLSTEARSGAAVGVSCSGRGALAVTDGSGCVELGGTVSGCSGRGEASTCLPGSGCSVRAGSPSAEPAGSPCRDRST